LRYIGCFSVVGGGGGVVTVEWCKECAGLQCQD